jgi:hypothetical protein
MNTLMDAEKKCKAGTEPGIRVSSMWRGEMP